MTELLDRLSAADDTQTVVLPRTPEQGQRIRSGAGDAVVVAERPVDGRSLVAFADVLVSAGGTMNREAAVLGTPVWSIFEGRLGAVDELLVSEGRLRLMHSADELEVARKPGDAWERRSRRQPRDLLEMALPWLSGGRR